MRQTMILAGLLALLSTVALASPAPFKVQEVLKGKIVHIADGDTITLLDGDKVEHRIRLWGIDCPESSQAFGNKAKESAKTLAAGAVVVIDVQGTDRYGRSLGWIHLPDGSTLNEAQVEAGYAWWYEHYAPDAAGLKALEQKARSAGIGLWADSQPLAPWDWRRAKRSRR